MPRAPAHAQARLRTLVRALAAVLAALSVTSATDTAAAYSPPPYMGLDTWYAFGNNISEGTVLGLTNAAAADGLRAAGYRIVWLDSGWWTGTRDANGTITVDEVRWPHGMAWLAAYIHSMGMRAGIYTDAGPQGCGPAGGSWGHYQQDMDTFAAWGFDAVKVDYCGGLRVPETGATPEVQFSAIAQALRNNSSHRPMLLNISNPDSLNGVGMWLTTWTYAPALADSWRTGFDIAVGPGTAFQKVLRNLDWDALHPELATHGHFNDPDNLIPTLGLSAAQARAQFSMWAMLAAPLMLSADPTRLSAVPLSTYENREVIGIDQDPLGTQGTRVRSGRTETWVKPLADGSRAVALLNRSNRPAQATVNAASVGIGGRNLRVRDIWARVTTSRTSRLTVTVPANGTVLLRVSRAHLAVHRGRRR